MEKDIRWEQRFSNFVKALNKLSQAIDFVKSQAENVDLSILDEIVREGLIQRFEYTHELAWNVMKDFSEYQGNFDIKGSRDATRQAFKMGLIQEGEKWMAMIKSRNDSSHTYNEATASEIFEQIVTDYFPLLLAFKSKMESIRTGNQMDIF